MGRTHRPLTEAVYLSAYRRRQFGEAGLGFMVGVGLLHEICCYRSAAGVAVADLAG